MNSANRKRGVGAFVLAAVFCAHLNALPIESVRIDGLKRSKERVVLPRFEKFIGIDEKALNTDDVWAAVLDTGTLDPLKVSVADSVLVIEVREKWAIFPMPFAMWNSAGWSLGGAFLDRNAFGLQDQAMLVGMGSLGTGNLMFMVMYDHRAQKPFPGWRLVGRYAKNEHEYVDQNNREYLNIKNQGYALKAGINYPITGNVFTEFSFEFNHDLTSGGFDFVLNPEASFRLATWDGYFLNEKSASLNYEAHIQTEQGFTGITKFTGNFDAPLAPRLRITSRTGLAYTSNGNILTVLPPYTARVNILPTNFSAAHYAGASAGLETAVWTAKFGTLALLAAYQAVFSKGQVLSGVQFDHGVIAAMQLYLRTLAIPAVGGGVTYNVDKNYFQGFFSMGMSF